MQQNIKFGKYLHTSYLIRLISQSTIRKIYPIAYDVNSSNSALSWVYRPFFCNVTAQVFANPGWKTMEPINAKQKQITTVCNNVTQIFKISAEFIENKATDQSWEVFYLIRSLPKMLNWLKHLLTRLDVLLTFGGPRQPALIVYQQWKGL